MTKNQLIVFLEFYPEFRMCPECGGSGERIFPIRGKVIDCTTCDGEGVIKKES